jgi:hypothetical protein
LKYAINRYFALAEHQRSQHPVARILGLLLHALVERAKRVGPLFLGHQRCPFLAKCRHLLAGAARVRGDSLFSQVAHQLVAALGSVETTRVVEFGGLAVSQQQLSQQVDVVVRAHLFDLGLFQGQATLQHVGERGKGSELLCLHQLAARLARSLLQHQQRLTARLVLGRIELVEQAGLLKLRHALFEHASVEQLAPGCSARTR